MESNSIWIKMEKATEVDKTGEDASKPIVVHD